MNNAHGVLKLMEVLCYAPSLIGWLAITKHTVLRSLNEIEVLGQGYPELGTYLWWISPLLSSYIPLQCTGAELSIDSLIKGSKIEQSWPSRNNLQSNRDATSSRYPFIYLQDQPILQRLLLRSSFFVQGTWVLSCYLLAFASSSFVQHSLTTPLWAVHPGSCRNPTAAVSHQKCLV